LQGGRGRRGGKEGSRGGLGEGQLYAHCGKGEDISSRCVGGLVEELSNGGRVVSRNGKVISEKKKKAA